MPKGLDINNLRKVLNQHQYEIAAELGMGESAQMDAGSVRNANANPDSLMSSRTGRMSSRPADAGAADTDADGF